MLTSSDNDLILSGYVQKVCTKDARSITFNLDDDVYGPIQCVAPRNAMYSFYSFVDLKKKYRFLARLKGHQYIDELGVTRTFNRIYLRKELKEGEGIAGNDVKKAKNKRKTAKNT